jgi:tetratricopeptide (TPR) repeat protein
LKEWEATLAFYEGEAYLAAGDAAKGLPLLQEAAGARAELLDPKSPALAEALIRLAECDLRLGKLEEARGNRGRAQQIIAAHPRLGRQYTGSLRRLEKLRMWRGELAEARPLR